MSTFMYGKTINKVMIADDRKAMLFVCEDGEHVAKADGDCCSDSWIEGVEMPALGFPAKVVKVEDLDLGEEENEEHECLAKYGCKITTDKGELVVDYRNSSNGYYGGELVWPDDGYFYGGVYGQNVSTMNWVEVE